VYAVCKNNSRALSWVAQQSHPAAAADAKSVDEVDGVSAASRGIMQWLDSREGFQPHEAAAAKATASAGAALVYSDALERAVQVAMQIGAGPVRDGDEIIQQGVTASEFVLAGIVIEGTSIGATALTGFSKGRVNSRAILEAINVAPDSFLLAAGKDGMEDKECKGGNKRAVNGMHVHNTAHSEVPSAVYWAGDGGPRLLASGRSSRPSLLNTHSQEAGEHRRSGSGMRQRPYFLCGCGL
jgi:hypothetical protein